MLIILLAGLSAMSQNAEDALRFSTLFSGTTSRSASLGGAMGALGGDQGAFNVNPAGLGVYRKSELSFTPFVSYTTSESNSYNTDSYKDYVYGMGIKNAGYVAAIPTYNETGLINFNLNFSYNYQNSFKQYSGIRIYDASSSLLDDFVADANQGNWYYTGNELALATDLIYDNDGVFMSDLTGSEYGQDLRRSIQTKGGIGEYQFGMGMNFNNNLFVGLNMGINSIRYESTTTHTEYNIPDEIEYLNGFEYTQSVKTSGLGFNAKLGMIYTPFSWLRLGIAAHSPVFYSLEDKYEANMLADLEIANPVKPDEVNNSGRFDYSLVSPPKIVFSGGILLGKYAALTADYEIADYSVVRLRSDNYDFVDENDAIQALYTVTHNIKAGAELRLGMISYRAGMGYYQSPYKSGELNENADRINVSGGIGINNGDYFIDFAYVNSSLVSSYVLYQQPLEEATLDNVSHLFLVTLGYKF